MGHGRSNRRVTESNMCAVVILLNFASLLIDGDFYSFLTKIDLKIKKCDRRKKKKKKRNKY